MKRGIRWAVRLYPARWRRRYEAEFDALLEDSKWGWRDLIDILRGAILMRLQFSSGGKIVAGLGVAGLVIAAVVAFRLPDRYISTAVVQFTAKGTPETMDRLIDVQQEILSRNSLSRIIQKLDLYRSERQELPLEDIVQQMRSHAISIRVIDASQDAPAAFSISYEYPDRYKAREVARELTRQFSDRVPAGTGPTLSVLDEATLPDAPAAPNRYVIGALGLALGVGIGFLLLGVRRWPLVAACAAAGSLFAFAASLMFPSRYVSTAVLTASNRTAAARAVQSLTERSYLHSLVEKFDLYPHQRSTQTMNEVIQRLRDLDIRIYGVNAPSRYGEGRQAFIVSFSAEGSAATAQAVVRELTRHAIEANLAYTLESPQTGGASMMKVLDPPTFPEHAVSPNREAWSFAGLFGGLLAGGLWLAILRRIRPTAPSQA